MRELLGWMYSTLRVHVARYGMDFGSSVESCPQISQWDKARGYTCMNRWHFFLSCLFMTIWRDDGIDWWTAYTIGASCCYLWHSMAPGDRVGGLLLPGDMYSRLQSFFFYDVTTSPKKLKKFFWELPFYLLGSWCLITIYFVMLIFGN